MRTSSYPLGRRYTVTAYPHGCEHYTVYEIVRRDGVVVQRDISRPDFDTARTREAQLIREGSLTKLAWEKDDSLPIKAAPAAPAKHKPLDHYPEPDPAPHLVLVDDQEVDYRIRQFGLAAGSA